MLSEAPVTLQPMRRQYQLRYAPPSHIVVLADKHPYYYCLFFGGGEIALPLPFKAAPSPPRASPFFHFAFCVSVRETCSVALRVFREIRLPLFFFFLSFLSAVHIGRKGIKTNNRKLSLDPLLPQKKKRHSS
jgi:hypothetical protein